MLRGRKRCDSVVNRCAIHHGGTLFDKGGEALAVEVRGRRSAKRGGPGLGTLGCRDLLLLRRTALAWLRHFELGNSNLALLFRDLF